MKIRFRFWVGLSIVLVYGVIAAGAIVRMTGSGMGCPDWPKCFGYLIPPTERAQLDWKATHDYQAGQVIIVAEELRVANNDFRSSDQYNRTNWEHYDQHDYAIFNPVHTWIEFLNRLLGALGGLATLVVGILSFWQWKKSKLIALVAWLIIFGMGFQAWLGKTVVDSNLQPFKITIHMVMALVIVALLLYLYYISKTEKSIKAIPSYIKGFAVLTLVLTLVQIAMGTQVRHDVEFQGDGSKATFYYTAENRVDFRQLIKDMAQAFSIRIEMRQIGLRQEASRLGGIGSCGRELCCSTWLTDFRTVSTAAARYQQLSLNPQKLAGQCGKLKCCLNFELDAYRKALKSFPKIDAKLHTEKGIAVCQKIDIFKGHMWYAYKGDWMTWHLLSNEQASEIVKKNKANEPVASLEEYTLDLPPKQEEKVFENVVGQDSLNRFDRPKKNTRNKKNNRDRNRNRNRKAPQKNE